MKKMKFIVLLLFISILAGCAKLNIEVFRFVNHEITLYVDQSATLDLIYGEYSPDSQVIYTLSKDDIIDLDDNVAIAKKVGQVTVEATIDGIKTTKVTITVLNEPISSMQIHSLNTITVGQTIDLSVTVYPTHISNDVIWSIEDSPLSDKNAAELLIDNNGKPTVKGLKGETTQTQYNQGGVRVIVVATSTVDPSMNARKEIRVRNIPTTSITLTAEKTIIEFGETLQLNAVVSPLNGYHIFSYSISNANIATVSSTGLVTAGTLFEGTVTITARTFDRSQTIVISIVKPADPVDPDDQD